jgi:NhaP-type Na+/H+ or K+/H+ antiporter
VFGAVTDIRGACGGRRGIRRRPGSLDASYQTRRQERFVWNSVDVLLEAFVFAYIALQLRFVLQDMHAARDSAVEVVTVSAIAIAVVLLIRPRAVAIMFARWRWCDHDSVNAELPQGFRICRARSEMHDRFSDGSGGSQAGR